MLQKIAVLLTVFNRRNETLKCLKHLFMQDISEEYQFDVYLTNDGCTDGTPEAIKLLYPQVHIINGTGNLYWNRGMFTAWSEAEKQYYDYFLWLNDDTYLFNDSLSNLLMVSKEKDNRAIIVGTTMDSEMTHLTYGGFDRNGCFMSKLNKVEVCYTWNGNVVLIPRYVYERVGKNDPIFHHAIGDTDYGLRASKFGILSYVADVPCGICDLHSSIPKWKDPNVSVIRRFKYLYAPGGNGSNPFQFFIFKRRHYGLIKAVGTFISNHLHTLFPQFWKR